MISLALTAVSPEGAGDVAERAGDITEAAGESKVPLRLVCDIATRRFASLAGREIAI